MTPERIIRKIIEREGGYVNDPQDPGGETNFGISKRVYTGLDIEGLAYEDAENIYLRDYWEPSRTELLPEYLQETYFDMAVNLGIKRAGMILQETINKVIKKPITVDGRVGPVTAKAAQSLEKLRLQAYRVKYYIDLINEKPYLEKFYYGWFKRAIKT